MSREIRIKIEDDGQPLGDQEYADLANAIWMFLRTTPHEFVIHHDGRTATDILNGAWSRYGVDATWS